MQVDHIEILLRRRDGSVKAVAVIDDADAKWAEYRWHQDHDGYAARNLPLIPRLPGKPRQARQRLHNAILGINPTVDGLAGDHWDGDRLNNRRANLKVVPPGTNAQNQPAHRDATSPYRGVYWHKSKRKWAATVTASDKTHYLGYFTDEQEAARVASAFRLQAFTHTNEDRAHADHPSDVPGPFIQP